MATCQTCDQFSLKDRTMSNFIPVALRIAMVIATVIPIVKDGQSDFHPTISVFCCRQVHAGCHTKTVGSWIQIVRQLRCPKSLETYASPNH